LNEIIAEKFTNIEIEMPIQMQEVSGTSNRHEQNRTSPWHIIVKTIIAENKERVLKSLKEKN
jgi:hypothetical protein